MPGVDEPHSDYWRHVEDLFHEALGVPPGERPGFLRERCAGDITLEREVAALVGSYEEQESLSYPEPVLEGRRYGPYEVVSKIGSGGMGDVFLAHRREDFEQRVAIKVIGSGLLLQPWIEERFRQERQILARLDHPSIARLLNGGVTPGGQPYLVMEYVEGTPLDEYCERLHLSVSQRLQLFRGICAAVQTAHEHSIIHRDLKPGNILVNRRGEPKLLDFGIAKVLEENRPERAGATTGNLLLTPGYSSPERLRGEPASAASDIYSLGVILYELLTGQRPHRTPDGASPAEIISAVITHEVRPPSESAPAEKKKSLRGGLDRIVMKALARKPEERYASVEELSDDLDRFLNHKPVLAQPAGARSRITRTLWMLASAALLGGIALLAARTFRTPARIDSLAVLPFRDLSRGGQSGYLADGLTDEVTNDFAAVSGLRVISRNSAAIFKGKTDVRQIGRFLHVQAVLQGSIARDGDQVHVRAQLNRSSDGSEIWSQAYDAPFRDLVSVQRDIARSITDDFQLSRSKSDTAELIPPGSTTDPEAHDLYLRGLAQANLGTAQGYAQAFPLMQAAIARDSHYAAPWYALSKMTGAMGYLGGWNAALSDKVRADLEEAIRLDPKMAVAHANLAYFDWEYGYDWGRAEREFQLALQLSNQAETHKLYAMSLADRGRFTESHAHLRIAEDLAPLDGDLLFYEGGVLAWEHRYPEAEEKYLVMLRQNPNNTLALAPLAYIQTWKKDCAKGDEYAARLMRISPNDYRTHSVHFAMLVCHGDTAGAIRYRADYGAHDQRQAFEMAQGYAYMGDKENALKYLALAVERHDFGATSMKQAPYLDSLHGDPRFIALERRVGLTP